MYTYRDTTAGTPPADTLPSEAVSIDGSYIETLMASGYQTLYVSGRESLQTEIETYSVASVDGEKLKSKRYPARTITVGFQLVGTSNADFRAKFNKLNGILVNKECKFIFNDEQDKYFTGIPVMETEIEPGRNAVTGEWQIYCLDPFKYAVNETTLDSSSEYWDSTALGWTNVPYAGTYKAFPQLKATCPSTKDSEGEETNKNEYAFLEFSIGEKAIQFGDPSETDYEEIEYKTKQYINHSFSAFGTLFTVDSGISLNGSGSAYPSDYGSGTGWHGPSMVASVPFSTGDEGAANFKAAFTHKMTASKKQFGGIRLQILDNSATPNVITEVIVRKQSSGVKCNIEYYANGTKYATVKNVKCSAIKATSIVKEAGKVTITCGKKTKSTTVSAIATTKAYKVRVIFLKKEGSTVLGTNSVSNITFAKNSGAYRIEENTFQPGDVVEADCSAGTIERNGLPEQNLGALGNDWEDFYLSPGNNTINVAYHGWKNGSTADAPSFEVTFRERYL